MWRLIFQVTNLNKKQDGRIKIDSMYFKQISQDSLLKNLPYITADPSSKNGKFCLVSQFSSVTARDTAYQPPQSS